MSAAPLLKWAGGKRQFAERVIVQLARAQSSRFWRKTVMRDNGCIEWLAGADKDGYGKFAITAPRRPGWPTQIHVRAHRLSFALAHGRFPAGVTRHECDNVKCVNAAHLLEGTQAQNRADCVRRGREPRGSNKPTAVLTEALVLSARQARANGESYVAIAKRIGVKLGTLRRAAQGKHSWRHV